MRVKFHPENQWAYGQDFRFFRGVPPIWFECRDVGSAYALKAAGYGGKPYGNGSLYLYKEQFGNADDTSPAPNAKR